MMYYLLWLLLYSMTIFVSISDIYAQNNDGDVLAIIGDYKITQKYLEDRIEKLSPNYKDVFKTDEGKKELLRELVRIEVFSKEARRIGLHKDKDFKARIAEITKALLASEYVRKVVLSEVKINDQEVRRYYEEHINELKEPEKIKAPHIFIGLPKEAPPDVIREKEEKAKGILERVKKGEDFLELMRESSEDIDKDVDYFAKGRLVPEIEDVVFGLEIGEVTPILRVSEGFLIFKLLDRIPERTIPYEEAREGIIEELRKKGEIEKFKSAEARLFSKYKVTFKMDDNLESSREGIDMTGKITSISPITDGGLLGTIIVEGKGKGFDKAYIKITTDTGISWSNGEKKQPANFNHLKVGQRVNIRFIGPVLQSYPVQAEAKEVLILSP